MRSVPVTNPEGVRVITRSAELNSACVRRKLFLSAPGVSQWETDDIFLRLRVQNSGPNNTWKKGT
jgi:hypothetical protein